MPDYGEVYSIQAELYIIGSNPVGSILSSLSRDAGDPHGASEINLNPLVVICVFADPRADAMESCKPRCEIVVEERGCSDGGVLEFFILKANRIVIEAIWFGNKRIRCILSSG